jgi:hypothetical protein
LLEPLASTSFHEFDRNFGDSSWTLDCCRCRLQKAEFPPTTRAKEIFDYSLPTYSWPLYPCLSVLQKLRESMVYVNSRESPKNNAVAPLRVLCSPLPFSGEPTALGHGRTANARRDLGFFVRLLFCLFDLYFLDVSSSPDRHTSRALFFSRSLRARYTDSLVP